MNIQQIEPQFTDQRTFSMHIENVVLDNKITHVEAILDYCKQNYLEPEDIAKLLSESIKQKIKNNFIEMKYLKQPANFNI